jgi:DNA-binding Lrp family transcriptional regulator
MKKIINHTNENLCSIFHARFKRLREIIPNVKQAQLLDYILLGWQTSNYKLKDSEHKWFMKEYKIIVEETGLSLSTLKRYIKELKEDGLIECKQALFSRSTEFGFEVKKANYIAITPKLLSLLQQDKSILTKDVNKSEITKESITNEAEIIENEFYKCSNLNKNELTEELNLSRSYIRDLYLSLNNNINSQNFVKNVNNEESLRANTLLLTIKKTLYSDIKEEIPDEIKNLVFGTFVNLVKKHKVILSSPKQVVAEYIFALINYDFFLKNVDCIKHRNNILAKLLKTNAWKTPKGFYNHFYLGENFKEKSKIREEWWTRTKENEIKTTSYLINIGHHLNGEKDSRLLEVENQMSVVNNSIASLKEKLETLSDIGEITQTRITVEELTNELHRLWDVQKNIEEEVELINQKSLIYSSHEHVA